MVKRVCLFLIIFSVAVEHIKSQDYHGITGLIQTPSAETDSAGTFRGNFSWVDKAMLPYLVDYGDGIPFSAPCYTIGLSLWKWLQLSYTGTLVKMHPNGDETSPLRFCNEDRHINIKLCPLYEGKWWPAISIGWDDAGNFKTFGINSRVTTSTFFENIYIAASKHIKIKGNEIGAHVSYRYYTWDGNRERRGVSGGLTFVPRLGKSLQGPRAWLQRPRLIVEWDGVGVNAGVDVLLWRHLFIQAALIHGTGFTGGLGYHYRIPY